MDAREIAEKIVSNPFIVGSDCDLVSLAQTHLDLVNAEPTEEMIEALYGPYLSCTANDERIRAYKKMMNLRKE